MAVMALAQLLKALDAQGVRLSARLVVDPPFETLSPALQDAMDAHRALLLDRVVRSMAWAELSAWRWYGADETPGIDRQPPRAPPLA
jgi:hypothetical protein